MATKHSKVLQIGDKVIVAAHCSKPDQGLTYDNLEGTLLDYAGVSEGWDVVDVDVAGQAVSIYCFSIIRRSWHAKLDIISASCDYKSSQRTTEHGT